MSEAQAGQLQYFRCHVGHTFSMESLLHEQNDSLERALWAAVRALEESAALSQRMSATEQSELRHRFREKAFTLDEHANLIRQILLQGGLPATHASGQAAG